MDNNENLLNNDLQVDTEAQRHLHETAKWAKFLSIIGFIFSGLMVILALTTFGQNRTDNSGGYYYSSRSSTMNPGFTLIILLLISLIWFLTSLYTYRFATKMRTALQSTDQITFNDSLGNLSRNYKFLGIVTIIYLGLIVLGIIASIFFASFSRA